MRRTDEHESEMNCDRDNLYHKRFNSLQDDSM